LVTPSFPARLLAFAMDALVARLEAAASGGKGKRKAVEAPAPEAKKPRRRFKLVKGIHNLVAGRDYPVGH